MVGRRTKFFETEAENRTFGELLDWHLRYWGTRPTTSPDQRGDVWSIPDFAAELRLNPRTVDYWLGDESAPGSILHKIEALLFGTNPAYSKWRGHLRELYAAAKTKELRLAGRTVGPAGQEPTSSPAVHPVRPDLMPALPKHFVGREEDVERLEALLRPDQGKPALVAITGMAGLGKTALARRYIETYGASYDGVWWCQADSRSVLIDCLAELASRLLPQPTEGLEPSVRARATLQYLATSGREFLIILDNVASIDDVRGWLPESTPTLVTSRFPFWSTFGVEYPLRVLLREESVRLLRSHGVTTEGRQAWHLANFLGDLPAALDHAAAFCTHFSYKPFDYHRNIAEFATVSRGGSDYSETVYSLLSRLLEDAIQRCPSVEPVITKLAFCAPSPLAIAALTSHSLPLRDVLAAVSVLTELGLVEPTKSISGEASINAHPVVQAVGRARCIDHTATSSTIGEFVCSLNNICTSPLEATGSKWREGAMLATHIFALSDYPTPWHLAEWYDLLDKAVTYFLIQDDYGSAHSLAFTAYTHPREQIGNLEFNFVSFKVTKLFAHVMTHSASDLAEDIYGNAIAFSSSAAVPDSELALLRADYAAVLINQHKYNEARRMLDQAILAIKNIKKFTDFMVIHRIDHYRVRLEEKSGRLAGAIASQRALLEAMDQKFRALHIYTLEALQQLADLLWSNNERDEALNIMAVVLERSTERFGASDRITIRYVINIGLRHHLADDDVQAAQMGRLALQRIEAVDYDIEPPVARILASTAFLLSRRQAIEEVGSLCDRAYEALKRGYPEPAAGFPDDWRDPTEEVDRSELEAIVKLIIAALMSIGRAEDALELVNRHQISSLSD